MKLKLTLAACITSLAVMGCATNDYNEYAYGLPAIEKTDFDSFFAQSTTKVDQLSLTPINITYNHNRESSRIYNDADFELKEREVNKLQREAEKAFAKYFSSTGKEQSEASYQLELHFDDLVLTAPLQEDTQVDKTFAEESGRMLLKGVVRTNDAEGKVVASFVDKLDIGIERQFPRRYSSVRFWSDMGHTLRRVAGKLQRSVN